jgi:DNA anti-recombination protein RmuC
MDTEASRPAQDPTDRAIDAVRREIGALKELLQAELKGAVDVVRVELRHVAERFRLNDDWRKEQKADAAEALKAALDAAKELGAAQSAASEKAITKSEGTTSKQIDDLGKRLDAVQTNLQDRLEAAASALDDKLDKLTATVSSIDAATH